MYLRITRGRFDPARADEFIALAADTDAALRRLPGFQSAIHAVDRRGGRSAIVTTWDTEEHARVDRAALAGIVARVQALGVQLEAAEIYEIVGQD